MEEPFSEEEVRILERKLVVFKERYSINDVKFEAYINEDKEVWTRMYVDFVDGGQISEDRMIFPLYKPKPEDYSQFPDTLGNSGLLNDKGHTTSVKSTPQSERFMFNYDINPNDLNKLFDTQNNIRLKFGKATVHLSTKAIWNIKETIALESLGIASPNELLRRYLTR